MGFATTGAIVDAICPDHHALLKTSSLRRRFRYHALRPLEALADAIAATDPALIVPCDDRARGHLHALHARCRVSRPSVADAIERSLGRPESFPVVDRRSDLIRIAREAGVRAPEMVSISNRRELAAGLRQLGFPVVMKVDGTWGGLGVAIVHTAKEAARAFKELSRPLSGARAIKRLLVDRDPYSIRPWLRHERPVVNIQRFVPGSPANCTVACWNGEVLAYIGAEVLSTPTAFGASTVVRIVDDPQMRAAATNLVRRLNLSGFCGFDFVIERTTGAAHLVEMNARSTPLTHLALGPGRDLVTALSCTLSGRKQPPRALVSAKEVVSFFPQAWHQGADSDLVRTSFLDVPWEDPELVRELMLLPWPERGMLARFTKRVRGAIGRVRNQQESTLPAAMSAPQPSRLVPTADEPAFLAPFELKINGS